MIRARPRLVVRMTGTLPATDAMVTDLPGVALATIVADCAPVVLFDPARRIAGVAHCGRQGAVLSVLPRTVETMREHSRVAGPDRVEVDTPYGLRTIWTPPALPASAPRPSPGSARPS